MEKLFFILTFFLEVLKMAAIKKKAYAAKKHSEQEILTIAHHVSSFVAANSKVFTISFAALAAVLIIAGAYAFKRSLDEQNAGPLLASAYEVYAPATGAAPDFYRALQLFQEVNKKYPSTKSGAMAKFYAANSLMNLGRTDEALKEYQALQDSSNDPLLRGLAGQRMGYIYRSSGNQADAIKAFERADSLIGPGVSTVELARLYEASGNSLESQKKYKMISEKLAGTTWGVEATGKVQAIQPVPGPVKSEDKKSPEKQEK